MTTVPRSPSVPKAFPGNGSGTRSHVPLPIGERERGTPWRDQKMIKRSPGTARPSGCPSRGARDALNDHHPAGHAYPARERVAPAGWPTIKIIGSARNLAGCRARTITTTHDRYDPQPPITGADMTAARAVGVPERPLHQGCKGSGAKAQVIGLNRSACHTGRHSKAPGRPESGRIDLDGATS